MKAKAIVILLFSSLIFLNVACEKEDPVSYPVKISFSKIGGGALYGDGSEGIPESNFIITNQTDWQNLINQMNSVNNVTDQFSELDIDFNTYELIAVFLEVKGRGWEVKILDIVENENNITVFTTENISSSAVVTQPFCVVKIPKTTKPIVFE